MYKQGYLEIYEDSNGFICIVSCPTSEDEVYGEIRINKEDVGRLRDALYQVGDKLKARAEIKSKSED